VSNVTVDEQTMINIIFTCITRFSSFFMYGRNSQDKIPYACRLLYLGMDW